MRPLVWIVVALAAGALLTLTIALAANAAAHFGEEGLPAAIEPRWPRAVPDHWPRLKRRGVNLG